jgi:predicted enzyme related to lactoylglutathione lyase
MLKVGGHDVGGCMEPPVPDVPNHWRVYFAVDDADATAAKAAAEGGQVAVEPFDVPWARLVGRGGASVGRSAVLADPQGAAFSVVTLPPQQ